LDGSHTNPSVVKAPVFPAGAFSLQRICGVDRPPAHARAATAIVLKSRRLTKEIQFIASSVTEARHRGTVIEFVGSHDAVVVREMPEQILKAKRENSN
jgi:hypothetical protein